MAEVEREREQLTTAQVDPKLYYDYEGRFIKQTLERDRVRMLPRVVKPAMFAPGGHALGDVRVFERFTVAPLSAFTCRFVTLGAGESTPLERRIPSLAGYVIAGDGVCEQDGVEHACTAGDVVFVPPYTKYRITAGSSGLRMWVPETRLWHVLGLLWHEHFEPQRMSGEVEDVVDAAGKWTGYRIARGVLGLEHDAQFRKGADARRSAVFDARRAVPEPGQAGVHYDQTQYDALLRLLAEEKVRHERSPRVIAGADRPWEDTCQGRLKYYIDNWANVPGQDLDMAAYEIEPGGHTGRHRHVPEEMLLVLAGAGHDVHDGSEHPWRAGDLICVPAMTEHQHFNDGDTPARLVSVWAHQPANEFMGGIEHIADASSWRAR